VSDVPESHGARQHRADFDTDDASRADNVFVSGRVTDSATGAGISSALVSIADGPNAHLTAMTDASGNYRFSGLQESGFTVNASAVVTRLNPQV